MPIVKVLNRNIYSESKQGNNRCRGLMKTEQLIHVCMACSKNTGAEVTNAYDHAVSKVVNGKLHRKRKQRSNTCSMGRFKYTVTEGKQERTCL